jgi:hypothetical protein
MRCRVELDLTGWEAMEKDAHWQTVACDEMKILVTESQAPFPPANDLDRVREFFRQVVTRRKGALISCDPLPNPNPPMFRMVYKYPTGRQQAVTFEASLALPVEKACLELLITASEDNFTGLREAMVMRDLMATAGISEREQLARQELPIEWKFERYHPGTRAPWAYLISDDERYDAAYPRHPLTRVRRLLRRIEKTYRVIQLAEPPEVRPASPAPTKTNGESRGLLGRLRKTFGPAEPATLGLGAPPEEKRPQYRIEISALPLKPMTFEELVRELGIDIASDAVMIEALKRIPAASVPSLATRQECSRKHRDDEIKKIMDREAKLQSIREAGMKMKEELTADSAKLILPRIRASGRWLVKPEAGALALTTFTSMASFDDYTEVKGLPSELVVVTLRELFSRFGELRELGIDSLTIDRCPRCNDERVTFKLDELSDETKVLSMYAVQLATQKHLVQQNLQLAAQQTDTAKRLEMLQYIIDHMNPGSVETRVEIARIAIANLDAALYERCRAHIARYAPDQLALLPEMPVA